MDQGDRDRFIKLSDCFVNQYGGYSPVPGAELNGRLTLGENTADNGGIRLAYLALLDDLAKKSIPVTQTQDCYTQTQQFFLGFAQVWCEIERPEAARLQVQTRSACARSVPRRWNCFKHAGIRPSLQLQANRQDGGR